MWQPASLGPTPTDTHGLRLGARPERGSTATYSDDGDSLAGASCAILNP
jgi:hypothetical protein